jgi:hypothetical protein
MLVLSDADTVMVGKAFDRAWDNFLKKGLLTPHNLHDARNRLAERILRSVLAGERDEWRLARDAVAHLQELGHSPAVPSAQRPVARPRFRQRRTGARRRAARPDGQTARSAAHFAAEDSATTAASIG